MAGANVVMPNLSPLGVRKLYTLYDNKICTGDEAAECLLCMQGRIRGCGFDPDMGRGDSLVACGPAGALGMAHNGSGAGTSRNH
jgi:biotin synthase